MFLLIGVLLAAGPSAHRAKAEHAEALGRMQEAARELEAAWDEEQAPELLYRLGLARRKLKQYAKAREAFRAYLRVAPQGGLREEVTRQLAKLEVLIEAQAEDYSDAGQPAAPRRPAAPSGEQRSLPQTEPVNSVHQGPPARSQEPVPQTPAIVATPAAPAPAPLAVAAPAPAAAAVPFIAAVPPAAAPAAPVVPPPPRSRVAPWLAAGGVVAAGGGAYLWWDGARVARDLDARYASGDLAAADRPLFGRARGESIGGRVLVVAGAALLAGAVVLWW